VTVPRVFAAALSVAVSEALLIVFRMPHTPAGTTTLLVALGLFTTPRELASLAAGIVLVTVAGWTINRALGAPVPVWAPSRE
jgi:CBS domain-containing membrane protein